nr:hypothetical protein [Tanacetum cinerariifolium]
PFPFRSKFASIFCMACLITSVDEVSWLEACVVNPVITVFSILALLFSSWIAACSLFSSKMSKLIPKALSFLIMSTSEESSFAAGSLARGGKLGSHCIPLSASWRPYACGPMRRSYGPRKDLLYRTPFVMAYLPTLRRTTLAFFFLSRRIPSVSSASARLLTVSMMEMTYFVHEWPRLGSRLPDMLRAFLDSSLSLRLLILLGAPDSKNQPNSSAGIQEYFDADPHNTEVDATFKVKEPESEVHVSPSSSAKIKKPDDKTKREAKGKSPVELSTGVRNLSEEFEDFSSNSTNEVNAASTPVPVVRPNSTNTTNTFHAAGPSNNAVSLNFQLG